MTGSPAEKRDDEKTNSSASGIVPVSSLHRCAISTLVISLISAETSCKFTSPILDLLAVPPGPPAPILLERNGWSPIDARIWIIGLSSFPVRSLLSIPALSFILPIILSVSSFEVPCGMVSSATTLSASISGMNTNFSHPPPTKLIVTMRTLIPMDIDMYLHLKARSSVFR